jgi:hypothetical protein
MTGFSKDWWASVEAATTLGQRLGTSAEELNRVRLRLTS